MASAAQEERIIRPAAGWPWPDLNELWHFRDLFLVLGSRDLALRYRQTALGIIWVVLQPVVAAGLFAFVFGRVAKLPSGGVPYFLFAFAGAIAWNSFLSTFSKASLSLTQQSQLISKVFFPRLLLPLSTVASTLVDFVVSLVLLGALIAFNGIPVTPAMALLPVWLVMLQMLALGAGFFAAALTATYRDVQHALPVVGQTLLYASPVAYSVDAVPQAFRKYVLLNPLAPAIEGFRWSALGVGHVSIAGVAYCALLSLICLVGGALYFNRRERLLADVI